MIEIAWYSDFDGVFNIPKTVPSVTTMDILTKNSTFLRKHTTISWNPEVLESFVSLVETGMYDFTWLTTWNDAGNIKLAAETMGIPDLHEHIPANLNKDARGKREWTEWKAHTIVEDQKLNPRPYIWIDDDAPLFWEDYVRGHTRSEGLIIKPHRRSGLTKKHLLRILDWSVYQQGKNVKSV